MSFNEFIGEREREIKADVNRLEQENQALKKQLSEIKYLDRNKVEKELWKFYDIIKYQLLEYSFIKSNIEKSTSNILSLALPTRERIIGALDKHFDTYSNHDGYKWNWGIEINLYGEDINHKYYDNPTDVSKTIGRLGDDIASEILGEEREDENI